MFIPEIDPVAAISARRITRLALWADGPPSSAPWWTVDVRPVHGAARRLLAAVCGWLLWAVAGAAPAAERPPNVIVIITDDQGYGDVGAHGNTMLKTPQLDRLHAQSLRLTNFHVDPTCSPTRAALLTGRYSTRAGVWHTIMGRSLLPARELTIAEVFADNGYRTGLFGKWHLGDSAPLRPMEQGFHEAVYHGGGGVTQTPDWFGNDYFDDVYLRNGVPEQFSGYCTDVFFREALSFIERRREWPFFCALTLNAPHAPYFVADEWKAPYLQAGVPEPMASFYGMIANFDHNLGVLLNQLDASGLTDETLVIFLTDNGSAAGFVPAARGAAEGASVAGGWTGFNAGMRGLKGSEYDGGHRVPCFIRWEGGGLAPAGDIDVLCAHFDLFPTLVELCDLQRPDGPPLDGASLAPVLRGDQEALRDRRLFVHSQRVEIPEKGRQSCVMTDRWRLVGGAELFDIRQDPGQSTNVAGQHPEVVRELQSAYDAWWESLSPAFEMVVPISLGHPAQNPAALTGHDWHAPQEQVVVWQDQVRRDPAVNGAWIVDVEQPGTYDFTLRSRPVHAAVAIPETRARVQVGEHAAETEIHAGAEQVVLTLELAAARGLRMQTWLEGAGGASRGAYYVEVRRR